MAVAATHWNGLRRAATGIKVIQTAKPDTNTNEAVAIKQSVTNDSAKRLVLICIDARRADYFSFADIPNLKKLMAEGATYDQAWVGHLRSSLPLPASLRR